MAMGMAITLGIREQYALAGIFMLTWATQTYGFLTEYISTPKAYVDKQNYKYPVGPYQLKKFAEGATDYGVTNYYEDPNALKLIDQTEWYSDRPMYDIKAEPEVATRGAVSTWQGYSHVRSQRTANWLRCAQTAQTKSQPVPLLMPWHPSPPLHGQAHGAARLRLVHHDLGLVHPLHAARARAPRHPRGLRPQHSRVGLRGHHRHVAHLHVALRWFK